MRGISSAKRKSVMIAASLILFFLTCIFMLTSLSQMLPVTTKANSGVSKYNPIFDNPVFSPFVRASHLRNLMFSPGARVIYDKDVIPAGSLSWHDNLESEWWVLEDDDQPAEFDLQEGVVSLFSAKSSDPRPRLLSRDLENQALLRDYVNVGVADLLSLLHEQDLRRLLDQDGSEANPFEEALKNSVEDAAPETEKATDSDSDVKDQKSGDRASETPGVPEVSSQTFLFIGDFNDQAVSTAVGTARDIFRQAANKAVQFEMAGIGSLSFDLNVILRSAADQESIALGDLSGDGYTDLVVTGRSANEAYVYLNDRQGGYVLSGNIYGGLGPVAAAIDDFGGEELPDVAMLLQTDRRIVVDGKGLRKFIFLPTSNLDRDYSSLMPYDFDGDGIKDLLLTDFRDFTSSVYLNQGKGTFVQSGTSDVGPTPYIVSRMDLNGDGLEDLVYVQTLGNQMSIVLVNGKDGSISSLGTMVIDSALYYVVGDFNQNGVADIAIARQRKASF